jgi:NADH:ubiquinone oxidoreductase subunit F (NADH-binding)/NADH:ubiquinone oxidoreductase subunit E
MTNKNTRFKPIPPEVIEITKTKNKDPESLLDLLTSLQSLPDGLSKENIIHASRYLNLPVHRAYGVTTFYSMVSTEPRKNILRVCDGPVCWIKRAMVNPQEDIVDLYRENLPSEWTIERSSCLGLCDRAPAVLVNNDQSGPIFPNDVKKACQGWEGVPSDYSIPRNGEKRVMLANIGKLDPDDIHSAIKFDAYQGLRKALQINSEEVISQIEASGLQGRGGAGFPVGRKWKFVAQAQKSPKYIIANADESEPLIFKDRVLMDTNPHQLLEGMAIGGYACGANEAYIYIRGEYVKQAHRLEHAIQEAEKLGWLGDDIQGSGFSFHVHVHLGAGAYICGEETALIESLEGKRGEPRLRPPYPPSSGFRGCPTAVNNVESFSAVPHIMKNGPDWWKSLSTYSVPGTKLYMLIGHVKQPGLFEAPFGLTLRQIIDDFGGGMLDGSSFNFALTGGAAGTLVNTDMLDIPLDYASSQKGIGLGAGAFLVCDKQVSPVAFLRELLHFFSVESCGKCTPCRVGTFRSYDLLCQMSEGKILNSNIKELKALADNMLLASFCGLGQSVPIPIYSALANFSGDFSYSGE